MSWLKKTETGKRIGTIAPNPMKLAHYVEGSFGGLNCAAACRTLSGDFAALTLAARHRARELARPGESTMPRRAAVLAELGKLWEKRQQPDKAREAYQAALNEHPDFKPAKDALAHLDAAKS